MGRLKLSNVDVAFKLLKQKFMRIIHLSVFLLLLSCCACISRQQQVNQAKTYNFSPIRQKIQTWIDSAYYPGAAIWIAQSDTVLWEEYFGNYGPDTVVFIASAGKWLAAATVAAVVEEGKLSWDDPVVKWLPEFKDSKGQATLRQLFSHTAGYPDYQPKDKRRDDYQTLEESVRHILPLPADTTPGSVFHYGGLAMQVGGRMAELVTGKSFEQLFQEKIAQPLGMKHTHFVPVDLGGGHSPMVGGGARSTLRDYASFLDMIAHDGMYRGKRILQQSSIQEMQADEVKNAQVNTGEFVEKARGQKHRSIYGLGEWRELLDEQGNAVLISSPSWAGAYPWIDKETGVYGFFITHVNVEVANRAGFSAFYGSPPLAMMVREVLARPASR